MSGEIVDDTQLESALKRIEALWNCQPGTPEMAELETLVDDVDKYEERRWPLPEPTPAEAAAFRAEQAQASPRRENG